MPPVGKIRERECQKCAMHGVHIKVKGHKFSCLYRDCQCERCQIITVKRHKNKLVIAQKRRLDQKSLSDSENMDMKRESSENSDSEVDMTGDASKSESKHKRAVYCRRCQVHGLQNILRGHKDKCAFRGCWCSECRIITQALQGSSYSLCSHCGYYPPRMHSPGPYVHPYPRPIYPMPPLILPQQNYSNTNTGSTDTLHGHQGFQSQIIQPPLPHGNLPHTYDSTCTWGYSSLQHCRPNQNSLPRNCLQQEIQTPESVLPSCQQEARNTQSILRNCLEQGTQITPATLQLPDDLQID